MILEKRARLSAALVAAFAAFSVAVGVRAEAPEPAPEDGEIDEPISSASASAAPLPQGAPPHGEPKRPIEVDGMLRIPGGTFSMGSSDPNAPPNERPPHSVVVKPFFLDKNEVTVGAYRACVEQGRCAAPPKTSASCTYLGADGELPITCVHWADADRFCRTVKKRLPTEAEWEFAAKGGSGAAYPWGGSHPSCVLAATLVRDTTSRSCSGLRPWHVGSHPAGASAFGVFDLSGNAEEWVSDFYAEHLGPVAPRAGASHVLRGGGWLSGPGASRTSSRNWGSTEEAGPNVGFRCARGT